MALKQDERALLQLVCERGQSYEDLAGLLGISEREVRAKARGALGELGGADPDSEVGLTDYLLGQADPIGRADAVRYLQQEPEARELAETIVTKLQAIAPAAELPKLPEPKGRRRKAAGPTAAKAADRGLPDSPRPAAARASSGGGQASRQTRLIAALGLGGLIVLFAILAIAGVFDGGGNGDAAAADPAEAQRDITPVPLSAQDGSGVGGLAEFGLANDQLFVDLQLDGLDPDIGRNKAYVLWMMLNRNAGYPVTLIAPGPNGSVNDRFTIPAPVAVVVGGTAQFVEVSESPADELQKVINAAVQDGAPVVPFAGTSLARGRIPAAQGADGELSAPELDGQTPPEGGGGNGGGG